MRSSLFATIALLFSLAALVAPPPARAFLVDHAGPEYRDSLDVIVIDPGHGGIDTGAVGPGGLEEKTVALEVGMRLADELRARLGSRVVLTRTGDTFLTLDERTAIANRERADIFISIHANAALNRDASGIETFFLSFDATDEDARRVAEFENSVAALGRAEDSAAPDDLREILMDLMRTAAHHESFRLAQMVHSSVVAATGKENRGVKQAPFMVLSGAAMPAILVEVGFISNPVEERWLASSGERVRIAESISKGVAQFRRATAGKSAGSGRERVAEKN